MATLLSPTITRRETRETPRPPTVLRIVENAHHLTGGYFKVAAKKLPTHSCPVPGPHESSPMRRMRNAPMGIGPLDERSIQPREAFGEDIESVVSDDPIAGSKSKRLCVSLMLKQVLKRGLNLINGSGVTQRRSRRIGIRVGKRRDDRPGAAHGLKFGETQGAKHKLPDHHVSLPDQLANRIGCHRRHKYKLAGKACLVLSPQHAVIGQHDACVGMTPCEARQRLHGRGTPLKGLQPREQQDCPGTWHGGWRRGEMAGID